MFASVLDEVIETGRLPGGCPLDEAGVEVEGQEPPPLPGCAPSPDECGELPWSQVAPSGWLGLDLDRRAEDPARLSDAQLVESVVGFERLASWAQARQARLLAEFTRRRPAGIDNPRARSGRPSPYSEYAADEIALALRCAHNTAAGRLHQAVTLAHQLGATLDAWESGRIDGVRARAIVEAVWLLGPDPDQRRALQDRVLARAGELTPGQLRAALARAVCEIDPAGTAARHRAARADRRVEVGADSDGMASLWAWLSAPDATAAYERLGQLARELGADDPRGMDARRADLLVELLTGRRCGADGSPVDDEISDDEISDDEISDDDTDSDEGGAGWMAPEDDVARDGSTASAGAPGADSEPGVDATAEGTASELDPAGQAGSPGQPADAESAAPAARGHACRPGTRPGKPLVHVIVPISMLLGLDETPGELVGHGPIPADVAREIAGHGTWQRLLTDPKSGTLLDVGRTRYRPPAGLADFVRARDLTCRQPICATPATRGDLDHLVPYPDGPTAEHNLHGPCRHHHRTKTLAPGWEVTRDDDGTITWTTPTGHSYDSHPHDYRTDPPPTDPDPPPTDPDPPPTDPDPPPF